MVPAVNGDNSKLNIKVVYAEKLEAQLPGTLLFINMATGGREVTGKARQTRLTREVKERQVPGNLACRQYLNVVYGFRRRNGCELSVVKLLF